MLAGEAIYLLPYIRKTFQTSLEEVFQVSSTELGFLSSMFGILALIFYFPGGWLADRYSARRLLTLSAFRHERWWSIHADYPELQSDAYSSCLLGHHIDPHLLGSLLKATRLWGTTNTQGASFGLLEGGRGATAAIMTTIAFVAFASATAPIDARTLIVTTWGVQCFLGSKIGECKVGKPIRFEVRATSPEHARIIANTAGQRKKKWNRCFRVSRQVRSLPTCNPKSGAVTK